MVEEGATGSGVDGFVEGIVAHARGGDPLPIALSPRDRETIAFALRLTLRPAGITPEDLARLRDVGLDDGDILDLVHVIGYYAYANRIADGLGVVLEPYRGGGQS